MFVGIGEESDKGRESVSEAADRRRDRKPVISRAAKDLGMYIVSDDSGVGDVDWNHDFLHWGIEHDLSRFGVAKDVKFCAFVKVSWRAGLD